MTYNQIFLSQDVVYIKEYSITVLKRPQFKNSYLQATFIECIPIG